MGSNSWCMVVTGEGRDNDDCLWYSGTDMGDTWVGG